MNDSAMQRSESLALLRTWLPKGSTVLTSVLHRSRTGLETVVGCWGLHIPERAALKEAKAALSMARCGERVDQGTVDAAGLMLRVADHRPRTIRLFGHVARVLGRRADLDRGGVVFRGGNCDFQHELVHDLSLALYGDHNALSGEEL